MDVYLSGYGNLLCKNARTTGIALAMRQGPKLYHIELKELKQARTLDELEVHTKENIREFLGVEELMTSVCGEVKSSPPRLIMGDIPFNTKFKATTVMTLEAKDGSDVKTGS